MDEWRSYREAWHRRWKEAGERSVEQRRRAREESCRIARHLKDRYGCRSVRLIGSVVGPRPFREDSDIDLLVEGLPPRRFFDIQAEVSGMSEFRVDLIPRESAWRSLLELAARYGEDLE